MAFIFLAVASILFVWCLIRWKMRAYVKLAYKVPSNRWHTLFGLGKFGNKKDIIQTMSGHREKYGPTSVFWIGPIPAFFTIEPQLLKEILTSKNCMVKPQLFYDGITSVIGHGIISLNDPIWSRHRKVLNKAFSHKNLVSILPIFYKGINSVIEEINGKMDKGEIIEMWTILEILTFKNSSQTVLKRNIDLSKFDAAEMNKNFKHTLRYMANIIISCTLKISLVRKLADIFIFKDDKECVNMLKAYIDDSIKAVENNDTSLLKEPNSVLDFALSGSNQGIIKIDEIQGETLHLFAGAFETSSTTLFLVIVLLAMNPKCQEQVYDELISIVPDDDAEWTVEELDQLVYLEMVLNETMRLFPTIPIVGRKVTNENLPLSNGLTLPIGQMICINIFCVHRNKDIWGADANVFNPDNFLPSNVATRHPFSFIPFTKGQRFCIGWRYSNLFAKITLGKLIKRYKFSTDFKYEDLIVENHISLKLQKEPSLYLEKRAS